MLLDSMPERLTLIVNPSAGRGRVLERWPELPSLLSRRGEVDVTLPASAAAVTLAARAAAAAGRTIIVAGGDGTLNRVLNAVNGFRVRLGVLPVGSGNDFARCVGLPADPLAAARRIAAGTASPLDLVEVNGHLFATVGGLGLVADTSALVNRAGRHGSPWRPIVQALGSHAYLLAAAAHIALSRRTTTRVIAEGRGRDGTWQWEGACHAVFVANQPLLGAGLRLPVASSSNDGECEVCMVPQDWRVRLALNLACLRGSRPVPDGALIVFRATRATIRCADVAGFAADGEVFESGRRFSVTVRPAAVDVLA
jgi:YegS/Rv2252/BmrU family lipid kinase